MAATGAASAGALVLFMLVGCCHVPVASRYFDRGDPFNTVQAFAYAIDIGQWRFAYDCLTLESKKHYTYTLFRIAVQFNIKIPDLEIGLRDVILAAERYRYRAVARSSRRAEMTVQYTDPESGTPYRVVIYLERESDEAAQVAGRDDPLWLIDLERTVRELSGSGNR